MEVTYLRQSLECLFLFLIRDAGGEEQLLDEPLHRRTMNVKVMPQSSPHTADRQSAHLYLSFLTYKCPPMTKTNIKYGKDE